MSPNVIAFLRMLYACEGTAGENGYRTLFGGTLFDAPPWEHPRRKITAGGYTSTAAGAPQILAGTWDDFIRAVGPRAFDPAGQDECAVWLISRRGATADVEAGRLEAAIAKCGKEWASLPGSPYGQPTRTLQYCLEHYLAAGGRLDASAQQPAAPIEDHSADYTVGTTTTVGGADNSNAVTSGGSMPIAIGLLAQLIPSVIGLFSGRAQATIAEKTGADPQLAGQFMQNLIQKVGDAVSVPVTDGASAIQAVAALTAQMKDDDARIAKLESGALDYLHDLTQAMQGVVDVRKAEVQIETDSANAASSRNDAPNVRERIDRKLWWAYGVAGVILATIAIVELVVNKLIDGQIIGALILAFGGLGGAIITMVNYGYGSSGSSGAKDLLIGDMARRSGAPTA